MALKTERPGVAAGLFFRGCDAAFRGAYAPAWRAPLVFWICECRCFQATSAWFQGSGETGIKTAFRKVSVLL